MQVVELWGKRDSVNVSEAVATKERQRGVSLALLLTADRIFHPHLLLSGEEMNEF